MNNDIEQRFSTTTPKSITPGYKESFQPASDPDRVYKRLVRETIERDAEGRELKAELEWWE